MQLHETDINGKQIFYALKYEFSVGRTVFSGEKNFFVIHIYATRTSTHYSYLLVSLIFIETISVEKITIFYFTVES